MITNLNSIQEARKAVKAAAKAQEAAEAALRAAEAAAIEEPSEGKVITFYLTFPFNPNSNVNGKIYNYAAIRVGNLWFLTGARANTSGVSWDELLAFISRNNLVGDINVAIDWADINS